MNKKNIELDAIRIEKKTYKIYVINKKKIELDAVNLLSQMSQFMGLVEM